MELLHEPEQIIAQRYRIVEPLGEGASGTTYLAEDLQSHHQVALKVMSLRSQNNWKAIEQFEREGVILAQLNHRAIPRYLEYFHVDTQTDRLFYIVQQLAPGQPLGVLVENGWHATEQEVREIAIQILSILVYLHGLTPSVIHRDIKPDNIIRNSDRQVFLVDFGAVHNSDRTTLTNSTTVGGTFGTVVGTFGYMAPEQFLAQVVPATDLYGLGATLLFLLTHRCPADLPTDGLKLDFRDRVQISEEFADWLDKMLEPDVADRFPSAQVALAALQGKQISTTKKSRKSLQRKHVVKLGLATVAALMVFNHFKHPILNVLEPTPQELYKAAYWGEVERVKNYLERGVDVNAKGVRGISPLHMAAMNDQTDVARLLIAQGADINVINENGDTPLYTAVQNGKKEVVKLLIAKGIDVNVKIKHGRTLLHKTRSPEVAQLLIANGADVNARDLKGRTPLHTTRSPEVAQLLIAKSADVNAKDKDGKTPLHETSPEVGKLLIAKGADVNARNNQGMTPLHTTHSPEVAKLLIAKDADVNARNNQGMTPLHTTGSSEVAQLLIAKGADIKARDKGGKTPLHETSSEVAQLLIAKGADVNARDNQGITPLHTTASPEIAQLLIAKGADIKARDNDGRTLLHTTRSLEVAQVLIAKGADVHAKDKGGKTPLHETSPEVGKLLIAKGADVHAKDNQGITPQNWERSPDGTWIYMPHPYERYERYGRYGRYGGNSPQHDAAESSSKDSVEHLIAKGADINAKNNYGMTPLHMARSLEIAQLLIAKGADVNARSDGGMTLLHMTNSPEVAQLLIAKGAHINARNNEGKTPLHMTRSPEIAGLLIANGADVNAKDNDGKTPSDSVIQAYTCSGPGGPCTFDSINDE